MEIILKVPGQSLKTLALIGKTNKIGTYRSNIRLKKIKS